MQRVDILRSLAGKDFIDMVSAAWLRVGPDSVRNACVKAQIVSDLFALQLNSDKENLLSESSFMEGSFFDGADFHDTESDSNGSFNL